MTKFLELLNEAETDLEDQIDESVCDLIEDTYEDDAAALAEDFEMSLDDAKLFLEALKKRVSADGTITKVRSKEFRSRHATKTTGMSKIALKRRAKKSARSKKQSAKSVRMAVKKRAKAMRKRKSMGVK